MAETVAVEAEEPDGALACVVNVTAVDVFTKPEGPEKILAAIRDAVCDEVPDLSTGVGRAAVATRAHTVSRAKAHLEREGLKLVAEPKAFIAVVDPARKKLRDGCDEIRDEVRRPLTGWEDAEEAKAEAIRLEKEAEVQRVAEEAERLNEEAVAQAKADAEAAIQEAEDRATEAEEKRKVAEAQAKYRADQEAKREERRLEQAETDRVAAEEAEKERTRLAAEEAERKKAAAVQAERDRIEREAQEEEDRKLKAAADLEHREACLEAAHITLVERGVNSDCAHRALQLIANGEIPNVIFDYTEAIRGGVEPEGENDA